MAKPFVDDSTAASAASFNRMVYGGEEATSYMAVGFRIYYTGAAWSAPSNVGTVNEGTNLSFNFNTTTDELEVDLSGLTRPFSVNNAVVVAQATGLAEAATGTAENYRPDARVTGTDDLFIRFYDDTGSGPVQITAVDTRMDCQVILLGTIT